MNQIPQYQSARRRYRGIWFIYGKSAPRQPCRHPRPVLTLWDAFWGDRMGKVVDPFGQAWSIATHTEDLSDEEIDRRAAEWFASQGG